MNCPLTFLLHAPSNSIRKGTSDQIIFIMIFIRIKTETKITNLIKAIELALPVNLYIDGFILDFCHLTVKIYFGLHQKLLSFWNATFWSVLGFAYNVIEISWFCFPKNEIFSNIIFQSNINNQTLSIMKVEIKV